MKILMSIKTKTATTKLIFVAAALVCWCLFVAALVCMNSEYFNKASANGYPDALDYLLLGENLREHGVLSRAEDLEPDTLRTPVYPVFLAVLNANRYPWLLYACQSIAYFGGLFVMYLIAQRVTLRTWGEATDDSNEKIIASDRIARLAVLFMATDLILVKLCFEAMTEILFFVCFLFVLLILKWPRTPFLHSLNFSRWLGAGIVTGVSILIRPTLLYFAPLFVVLSIIATAGQKRTQLRQSLFGGIMMILGISILVVPWIIRNQYVAQIGKLSTVDTHNLVYFVGAGPYQIRHGVTRMEAQAMVSKDYDLPTYLVMQNPHKDPRTTRELESLAEEVKWEIVFDDPPRLVASSLIGVVKGATSHSNSAIGSILGTQWNPPGLSGLLGMQQDAWRRLFTNHEVLILTFFWQSAHTVAMWFFSMVGVTCLLRQCDKRDKRGILLSLLFVLGFGLLMIAPFGIDAVYRSRLVALPALYVLAALGIDGFMTGFSKWRRL